MRDELKIKVTNKPQKKMEQEEFISKISNDKSLLQNLSIERLRILNKYYDETIEKEEMKVKKLIEN